MSSLRTRSFNVMLVITSIGPDKISGKISPMFVNQLLGILI
jgi:hypothetical protein